MGQVLPDLLDLVRIPHRTLTADNYQEDLHWAAQILTKQRIPAALLVGKGILS
jgi:sulfopyruvate decarboxylase subunit alpha